MNKSR